MDRKKFEALAATTKTGMPTAQQIADNGGMKFKSETHNYDQARPKRQVASRYK
jgi:hypothetical protein